MRRFGLLMSASLIVAALVPTLRAQSCFGNGIVNGTYGFVGSRFLLAGAPVTPPGAIGPGSGGTGTTGTGEATTGPVVSNTPIGQLIGGLDGLSPFALLGTIRADGTGNFLAAANATGTPAQVGNYSVNSDCTISVKLTDVFVGLPVTPPGTSGMSSTGNTGNGSFAGRSATPPTPVSIKLEGLILDGGAEIDLVQIGTSDTGAVITLRRALQTFGACTDLNVNGPFDLVVRGSFVQTGSSGANGNSTVPTNFIGRFVANGAGEFTSDALGAQSPLQELQLTGTYTVNADCSGTAQLVDSTRVTHNATFVIVQAEFGRDHTSPELLIGLTDPGVNGFGFARQQ
jgi:hypothetical protein